MLMFSRLSILGPVASHEVDPTILTCEGAIDGNPEGLEDGTSEGVLDGTAIGLKEGTGVGSHEGTIEGASEVSMTGRVVGTLAFECSAEGLMDDAVV